MSRQEPLKCSQVDCKLIVHFDKKACITFLAEESHHRQYLERQLCVGFPHEHKFYVVVAVMLRQKPDRCVPLARRVQDALGV
eukprot:5900382-Prymnesium_polylepis.1